MDTLIDRSGLRSAEVLGILLKLELSGLIRQLSGKFFIRSV
jgi:predicted Rossmann fold nucleotide-binding protein DprA/Smf involved in DNA uptake